jgi:hypothetical protein
VLTEMPVPERGRCKCVVVISLVHDNLLTTSGKVWFPARLFHTAVTSLTLWANLSIFFNTCPLRAHLRVLVRMM